jgi:hypothetical protein
MCLRGMIWGEERKREIEGECRAGRARRRPGRMRHLREVEQAGGDEERVRAPLSIPDVELARLGAAIVARVVVVLD